MQTEGVAHDIEPLARSIPTIADVARIVAIEDPALRNLRITQCYHELAHAWLEHIGPDLSWCAFACWSSKQAGRAIRGGELERAFAEQLVQRPEATRKLNALADHWARCSWQRSSADEVRSTLDELVRPTDVLVRARAAAVLANLEIFSEIGLQFVRFLSAFRDATEPVSADIDRFCSFLCSERPPVGQALLQRAFRSYHAALFEKNDKIRAELVLLGNVNVALHEQERIEVQIRASWAHASEDAIPTEQLLDRLRPATRRSQQWLRRYVAWRTSLEERWREIRALHRNAAMQVVREHLSTIELPDAAVQVGRELDRSKPKNLLRLTLGDLSLLWTELTPVAGFTSARSDGEAWSDPTVRRYFMAELMRSYQDAKRLLDPPFTDAQLLEIRNGRVPDGPL